VKVMHTLLVAMLFSFPIGIIIFSAPDRWFSVFKPTSEPDLELASSPEESNLRKAIFRQRDSIRDLELELLKAKGEVLKLEEARARRTSQLEILRSELEYLITELKTTPEVPKKRAVASQSKSR
jgi:hypothetical protein